MASGDCGLKPRRTDRRATLHCREDRPLPPGPHPRQDRGKTAPRTHPLRPHARGPPELSAQLGARLPTPPGPEKGQFYPLFATAAADGLTPSHQPTPAKRTRHDHQPQTQAHRTAQPRSRCSPCRSPRPSPTVTA